MVTAPPVLVAIPGTLCSPAVFRALGERLAGSIVLDPVSWMTEPAPWDIGTVAGRVAAWIAGAHAAPVLVIGHSTGGVIALRLAADRPDLVAGLVLVNTGAHMRGHGDVDAILATIAATWGPELHAAVLDRSFATPLPAADRDELLTYAARVPQEATLEVLRSQRDLDMTPRLGEIACPAVVVHGVLDRARTREHAEELAAAIPGCTLRFVETGHSPVHEAPDAVAEEVLALTARAGADR